MAEQHVARVIIEGDSSSFVSATDRAKKSADQLTSTIDRQKRDMEDAKARIQNTADKWKQFDAAVKKANASTAEAAAAFGKSGKAAQAFSSAIKQVETGQASLRQGIMGVAAAFGPLGIAIGVAGSLLIGVAQDHIAAANAADEQRKALEKLRREEKQAAEDKRREKFVEDLNARLGREEVAKRQRFVDSRADELTAIENAKAQFGAGKDMVGLLEREAEIRAANARIMGDSAEATRIERDFELTKLGFLGEELDKHKKITAEKREQRRLSGNFEVVSQRALGFAGFRGNVAGASEGMRFDAEAGRVGAMQRSGSDTRGANDAQYAAQARLQALEIERATTGETLSLINQEEEARRRLLQTQIDAATIGAERQQLQAELEQVHHEARLKRIDLERAAEEKRAARKIAIMDLVDRVAAGSASTAAMIAKTAGASAKKQEQIAAGAAGAQALIVGALEQVKAVAAFASFNFVQGAAHQAAAIFAFAQGGMLLAQAGGAGGGRSGGASAGGGMPSGGTQSSPSGVTFRGSDSEIPGSPQSPSAATVSNSGPKRTTVININGDVVGTPRKEFIRAIREGLDLDSQGGRARRTGSD